MKKTAILLVLSLILTFNPVFASTPDGEICEIIVQTLNTGDNTLLNLDYNLPEMEVVYTFDSVMNGYVIKADSSLLEEIKNTEGVIDACISETVYMPVINENSASSTVGAGSSHALGYDGEGTVVAIIDSELDYNHDALRLANPENAKLKRSDIAEILTTKELNIPAISANRVYRNSKVPFAYDYCEKDTDVWDDANIHGTHVSGIVSGNNETVKGIAPESQIIFMKVFRTIAGVSLGTTADVFAAVEDAAEFGVSSINLSLSVDYAFTDNSTYNIFNTIIDNVRSKGIVISCSSGNLGRGYNNDPIKTKYVDYGISGIPSGFTDTLSVGSVNNKTYTAYSIVSGGELIPIDEGTEISFAPAFSDKEYEYFYASYGLSEDDFSGGKGKIALIEAANPKGDSATIAAKLNLAKETGIAGVIFISKNNSYYSFTQGTLPACMVSRYYGDFLINNEPKLLKANNFLSQIELPAIEVSDFSAWNYTSSLDLSVDLTAPGGMIYSSIPDNLYKSFSGTSMSAPQVTGASALVDSRIKKDFPDITGKEKAKLIENILMSSALPVKSEKGIYSSPMVQGAGLLSIENAIKTNSVLYGADGKTKLSLKDKISDIFSFSFTKKNLKEASDSYDTVSVVTLTDGYYEKEGEYYIGDEIHLSNTFSYEKEKVSDSETKYNIEISLNPEETVSHSEIYKNGFFVSGFVFLSSSDGSEIPLSIPFMGFYGDFTKPQLFDTLGDNFGTNYPHSIIIEDGVKKYAKLGYNMFDKSYHPDKMSVSPDGDGFNDTIYIYPRFLRDINYLYLMLLRSEYYSVSQVTKTSIPKFSGNSYYNIPVIDRNTGEIIEDGDYYINLTATLKYNPNHMKIEKFPLVFDTEKPEIHSLSETESGFELSVSDNHYIQAVVMEGFNSSGEKITESFIPDSQKGEKITVAFEKNGLSNISFYVYDYGYNKRCALNLNLNEFSAESFRLYFTNNENVTADIYTASFENNSLSDIKIKENESLFKDTDLYFDASGDTVKVFIWKSGSMIPENNADGFIIY